MNAPVRTPILTAPDDVGAVYDALADTMATAATYAETAVRFANLRDARALVYAIRATSAALLSAADLVEEVRPSRRQGGAR